MTETYVITSRVNDDGSTVFVATVSNRKSSGPFFVDRTYEERRGARVEDFIRDLLNDGYQLCSAEECNSHHDAVERLLGDMERYADEVTA